MDIAVDQKFQQPEQTTKHTSKGYNINEDWTKEIKMDEYNPQSFIKEYPTLKKKLQSLESNPRPLTLEIQHMLNKYQSKPELLDSHLPEICDSITICIKKYWKERDPETMNNPDYIINCALELLYTLCNIRGYKTIVNYLPHEVRDLEPTLDYLLSIDHSLLHMWYAKYILCIWLSIIVRVPFDLQTIDSSIANETMFERIIHVCKVFLESAGKAREGAAVLIARLFSRPDFETEKMKEFFIWSLGVLELQKNERFNIFLITGVMRTLVEIFKHAHRDALLPNAGILLQRSGDVWNQSNSRVLKKLSTKLIQRIGLVYLTPVIANWRYTKSRHILLSKSTPDEQKNDDFSDFEIPNQIENILHQLLSALKDNETVVRWSAAKGIGRIVMRLPKTLGDEVVSNVMELLHPTEDHEAWHGGCLCLAELARRGLLLPSRLPHVIQQLQQAMLYDIFQGQTSKGDQVRDAACYVAWAFARAYEPFIIQPYVQTLANSLLTIAVFDRQIHCRRAACAAFQENVGRQGNFPHGIEINTTADYWTVGLLRKAYLTVSKSIARFDEYKYHLIDHLVNYKLCYWELKIRELSAQTLYELTELDVIYMRDNVLPILIKKCESQSVFERHGGLCGVSQIIRRLFELKIEINSDFQKLLRNIIPKLEKNRGYRGKGGERIRQQSSEVIASLCESRFELSDKAVDRYQQTIDENLRIPQEFIQMSAIKALKSLSKYYYLVYNEQRCELITLKWCKQLCTETIASVTRGYALGLGVLSEHLVLPHLKLVVDSLISKSLITAKEETRDYETRKCCCIALANLVENVGVSDGHPYIWNSSENEMKVDDEDDDELAALGLKDVTAIKHGRNKNYLPIIDEIFKFPFDISDSKHSNILYDRIVGALLVRFEDYEVDRRGDVGSFVRQHCLMQIFRVMVFLAKAGAKSCTKTEDVVNNNNSNGMWLRPELPTIILKCIFRQLSEKLDRVRRSAGEVIELIFDSKDADVQKIRFSDDAEIRSIFGNNRDLDWSNPHFVFPLLVRALTIDEYRRCVFEGLLQSLGCINSSMAQLTLKCLEPYLSQLEEQSLVKDAAMQQLILLGDDIVYCCKKRERNPLFMIPFLKSIGVLLCETTFFEPLQNVKYDFCLRFFQQLRKECFKSTDIKKLLTAVKAFVGLCLFPQTREYALQRLLIFLGYQYPALRKVTAAQLYAAVVTYGDKICSAEKCDLVMEFFENSQWGGTDLQAVREQRNKLYELLGIRRGRKNQAKLKK